MKRIAIRPRTGWTEKVEKMGLLWHSADGVEYWNESAYYQITPAEVRTFRQETEECYQLLLAAGQRIIDRKLYASITT